jgi:hypothetical protein
MSKASNYGAKFFAVEMREETDMIFADRAECRDGSLLLYGGFRRDGDAGQAREEILVAAYAPGHWLRLSAASLLDGHAVAVDSTNAKNQPNAAG